MISIQRKFDLNNSVYTYLLEKRAEAELQWHQLFRKTGLLTGLQHLIQPLIKPKTKQNYSLAFILGFLLPVISIFLIDYLNNKIIDKKDVEKGQKRLFLDS